MIEDGLIPAPIPLGETVFTGFNLGLTAAVAVGLALLAMAMHPPPDRVVRADAEALDRLGTWQPPARPEAPTPAERLMHGALLNRAIGLMGVAQFAIATSRTGLNLTLDSVNLLVLGLALLLHESPAALLDAAGEAVKPLHGVVLQFPLYAGIQGIIKGTALAGVLADAFVRVATRDTFPLVVFWYSAVLDYFVPSGGGKWAIEALYVLKAGGALGVPVPEVAMAYAYGDMATNLVQPFWAIPLLAVARLDFRDILGFELVVFAAYTAVLSAVLLLA
jgi:short-chain fatty acids transporter